MTERRALTIAGGIPGRRQLVRDAKRFRYVMSLR